MLTVINAQCYIYVLYAECHYAECCYAECRGAVCPWQLFSAYSTVFTGETVWPKL
jgi:hypothetical protein